MQLETLRYLMWNANSAPQHQIGWVRISVSIALLTEGHNSPTKRKTCQETPYWKQIFTLTQHTKYHLTSHLAHSEKKLKHAPGKHIPNFKVLQSTCETYSPQSCCHDNPTTLTDKERAIATPNAETLLTEWNNEPTATTDIKIVKHTCSTPNEPSLAQTSNHLQ